MSRLKFNIEGDPPTQAELETERKKIVTKWLFILVILGIISIWVLSGLSSEAIKTILTLSVALIIFLLAAAARGI